ncbi:translation initiation factor IF-3 [Blochmannia endosymbiont of Camponotus (Colobopsis) obliquus]|uniref:translation initiation factor IF-3 n=1 Tax=Blochmannia endosymbiont of Camponotus (Colobopsis) obliquus TaxID=1505597 RepID=UPI00061A727E|nr:translation initiation factor IF-3 [Blochmannia endosymbiont of Camponotus (Colobopsis) obliquus]AKC60515.1 translation initiation factor IF-3 [Blochmannia endosymbiont of Camponotus (Colobopsis) obliquus]
MKGGKKNYLTRSNRVNQNIHAVEVRLTDINGKQVGIVSLREALAQAEASGADLVEISSNALPPVCRIMNYGKFLYEKNKSSKEQKKKQKTIQIKEIKFRPNTEEADYQVKLRNSVRFLKDGDKIKITLRFRGGEIVHQQIGTKVLNRVRKDLEQISIVEYFPNKLEGKQLVMILAPKK